MKVIKIKLTQDPYIEGYDGAFLRKIDENGEELVTGIWDNWYEANAEDEKGNEYIIYWKIKNEDEDDETDACDWDNPFMIIDGNGKNVTKKVKFVDEF